MSAHAAVRLFASFVLALSLVLANTVHLGWLGLTAFVGFNLIQFSFSGFCPAMLVMRWTGLKPAEPSPSRTAARWAQVPFGLAVLAAVGLGLWGPSLGLGFTTVVVGLLALMWGQSAFTGTCPMIWLMKTLRVGQPKTTAVA